MRISEVQFKKKFPSPQSLGRASVLIYDRYFEDNHSAEMKEAQKWISGFSHRLGFKAGEDLKDLRTFPEKLEMILNVVNQFAVKNVQIISMGGGSIGDFSGFVASILKRGLPLIHIPTTWLAAMDSSHGGKTALNVHSYKNQVGTFYPAHKIILIQPLLCLQPSERSQEAFAEAFKMAFLRGGSLWKKMSELENFENQNAWKLLPELIEGKYRIVKRDPFEKTGYRHLLNLGHTLGHVWEASQALPHGVAVGYGLRAAIELSLREKVMSANQYKLLQKIPAMGLLPSKEDLGQVAKQTRDVRRYLLNDKKISKKESLRFVLIERPGKCHIQEISIDKLIEFYGEIEASS